MSTRRRLLLALLSAVKWVVNRFTYIYNSIVPSGDYKKARLGKIEGNGEIVNQLLPINTTPSGQVNGITYTNNNDGTFTINGTNNSGSILRILLATVNLKAGHYYIGGSGRDANGNVVMFQFNTTPYSGFSAPTLVETTSNYQIGLRIAGNTTYNNVIVPYMFIDLTKEFGTGNEPTSLTDNRIKRIIAKGYIPTNSGTYDSSVVKEIEYSRLPDEYQEVEYIESTGTQYIDTGLKCSNNLSVELVSDSNGFSYLASKTRNGGRNVSAYGAGNSLVFLAQTSGRFRIDINASQYELQTLKNIKILKIDNVNHKINIQYTDDTVAIISNTDSGEFTSDANFYLFALYTSTTSAFVIATEQKITNAKLWNGTTIVRDFVPCYRKSDNVAGLYDLVNNVFYTNQGTGTFAVGNDISNNKLQLPQPIKLNGAINAHDTFEVLSDSYRFTRNVWNIDLGSLNWEYYGSNKFYVGVSDFSPNNNGTNLLCYKYISRYATIVNLKSGEMRYVEVLPSKRLYICDDAYTDATTFKTAMSGVPLYYQLATPQVIYIPKKHLKSVDMSTLSWTYRSGYSYPFFEAIITGMKQVSTDDIFNAFCSNYLKLNTAMGQGTFGGTNYNKQFVQRGGTNRIMVQDPSLQSTDTPTGILFYETTNEVQDFTNSLDIQSGGFLNAKQLLDEVCEVLPNVELKMRK